MLSSKATADLGDGVAGAGPGAVVLGARVRSDGHGRYGARMADLITTITPSPGCHLPAPRVVARARRLLAGATLQAT